MIDSFSRRCRVASAVLALGATLAACGGGGGNSDKDSQPPVQVTLSATTATATYPAHTRPANAPSTTVTATVANPPTAPVYVMVQDSGSVLQSGSAAVFANQDGSYTATMYYVQSLAAGVYKGTFQLKLCKDQACSSSYPVTGGALAYTLTVTQPATFTATVNGVPTPLQQFLSTQGLKLKDGDVLSLQASQPVEWEQLEGGVIADNVTSTTTSWSGTLRYGISTPGSTGDLTLNAYYLPDNQFSSPLDFFVTQ